MEGESVRVETSYNLLPGEGKSVEKHEAELPIFNDIGKKPVSINELTVTGAAPLR